LVTGVIAASWRTGLSLAAQYDDDLRSERLDAYRALWGRPAVARSVRHRWRAADTERCF
jgi:hypothetical protein